jgi:hypothetical protein
MTAGVGYNTYYAKNDQGHAVFAQGNDDPEALEALSLTLRPRLPRARSFDVGAAQRSRNTQQRPSAHRAAIGR